MRSTIALYDAFRKAYDFYNDRLFGGKLGDVVFTLVPRKGVAGSFKDRRFFEYTKGPFNGFAAPEISINPEYMDDPVEEVFSTLVHEMVHLWHHDNYGREEAVKNGGHSKIWADRMRLIGLPPRSVSGHGTGKGTGKYVTNDIEPGGLFDRATKELLASGFRIPYAAHRDFPLAKKKSTPKSTTYSCKTCDQKVRGKPGQRILCGVCIKPMV